MEKELTSTRKEQSIIKMINFCEHYLLKLFTTWPILLLEGFYVSETKHMFQNISYVYFCGKLPEILFRCPSSLSFLPTTSYDPLKTGSPLIKNKPLTHSVLMCQVMYIVVIFVIPFIANYENRRVKTCFQVSM